MDFLGVGPGELLLIMIILLIVIGPRDLSKNARRIGRFLNRMYRSESWRTITQASRNLRTLPNRLAREAALEELDELKSLKKDVGEVTQELDPRRQALKAWTTPASEPAGEQPGEQAPATAPGGDEVEARQPSAPEEEPQQADS